MNTIRAPRGPVLHAKGWRQEAALRMLMNNLDPDVAERPEELVVYGSAGKAARDWPSYHAIVRELEQLENDETLLVQSGKPVGVFPTHDEAPRVLIANSNLVGHWSNWEQFRALERLGLMMYGQMTAGSWIYIGSQGILQGTYETFAAAARKHFGGTLRGKLGCSGGMGGAQPLVATLNGARFLGIEVDPDRIARRVGSGYCDAHAHSLDDALGRLRKAADDGQALSVELTGNCAEVLKKMVRRGIVPDLLTDQTSAHDPLNGYVPAGLDLQAASALPASDPDEYLRRSMDSIAIHVRAMLDLKRQGAITFDYGNNIRRMAADRGVSDAFEIPGFVPEYMRPMFAEGRGPFRWVALSGEAEALRDGSDAVADWPILNALLNKAAGASWVSVHNGGGVGIGYSLHAGQATLADGTLQAARCLERVMTCDPGIGVLWHVDAGYEDAANFARQAGLRTPMQ